MLDHVSIGARNLGAMQKFYDAALQPLGLSRLSSDAASLGYGGGAVFFWIGKTDHPVPPHPDSGLHFCFAASTRASVDAFYAAAIASGGTDNGGPGLRPNYGDNYYAAFVIDPEGYRLEAYCNKPE